MIRCFLPKFQARTFLVEKGKQTDLGGTGDVGSDDTIQVLIEVFRDQFLEKGLHIGRDLGGLNNCPAPGCNSTNLPG